LVIWKVPLIVVAAVVSGNRWIDNKLQKCEEEAQKEQEVTKRYQIFSESVVPDLYRFYGEMDDVIESLDTKEEVEVFCENMDQLVDFMCVCEEPEGIPTVQNMVDMAMSARNSGINETSFTEVLREHLLGEIVRASSNAEMRAQAVAASAKIMNIMFPAKKPVFKLAGSYHANYG
jgi:hypothetical protein